MSTAPRSCIWSASIPTIRPASGSGAFDHIAFRAKDAESLISRLKAKGYPFRERKVPDMDLFQVFVEDPNGITVELNYWAAEQRAA